MLGTVGDVRVLGQRSAPHCPEFVSVPPRAGKLILEFTRVT